VGAPIGFHAVTRIFPNGVGDWSTRAVVVFYVGLSTLVAFSLFGFVLGVLLDRAEEARHSWEDRADHDALTGLANRRLFHQVGHTELIRAKRTRMPMALIIVDIDHFKYVNDLHGHHAGDDVLKTIAACIQDACRSMDTACRYGGEEFVVIAPAIEPADAVRLAERIRRFVEDAVTAGLAGVRVTVSAGVAVSSEQGITSLQDLTDRADARLYRAKEAGRNRVCPAWQRCADPFSA
jgi:diguanylate cyclase (GGDEF)-like protein